MAKGPFYSKDDVGAINRLVDKRTPRTDVDGVVVMVEPTGYVWCLIHGSSNAVVVDVTNGIAIKQGDKVSLRRFPNTARWTIYAVQTVNGTTGSGPGTPATDNSTTVAAPSNLALVASFGGVYISWEPPNDTSDVLFEVELSSDGIGTGAIIYKVAGSLFYFPCTTIQYARVRSLGEGWTRSGFTGRLSATPLNFLETLQDDVAGMLQAGSNITLTYNDPAGTLTIDGAAPAITVEEDDLSPSVSPVSRLIFPADSLTDDGGGVVRVNFPTGGDVATIKKTIQTETVIHAETLAAPVAYIDLTFPSGYTHIKIRARLKTSVAARYSRLKGYMNGDYTDGNYWFVQNQAQSGGLSPAASNTPYIGYASGQSGQSADNYAFFEIELEFTSGIAGHWQTARIFNMFAAEGENFYSEFMTNQWLNDDPVTDYRIIPTDGSNLVAGCYIEVVGYKPEQVVTAVSGDGTEILATTKTEIDTYTRLAVHNFLVDTAGPVVFSAIDQTYDHLEVRLSARSTYSAVGDTLSMTVNSDTTDANYVKVEAFSGTGTGAVIQNNRNLDQIPGATGESDRFQSMWFKIPHYSKTDRRKLAEVVSTLMRSDYYRLNMSLEWKNTAAWTSISLALEFGNFKAGSIIELWGIKRQDVVTDITGDLTSTVKEYETDFDYSTSSPLALRTANVNENIIECKIIIDVLFNDATSLHVGEMGGTSRLMAVSENDPLSVGVNVTEPEYVYSGGEIINLYITTSATAGAGRVRLITKG